MCALYSGFIVFFQSIHRPARSKGVTSGSRISVRNVVDGEGGGGRTDENRSILYFFYTILLLLFFLNLSYKSLFPTIVLLSFSVAAAAVYIYHVIFDFTRDRMIIVCIVARDLKSSHRLATHSRVIILFCFFLPSNIGRISRLKQS